MADLNAASTAETSADARRIVAAMEQWRRRSRLIHFFRKALPISIAAVTLSLFGWVGVKSLVANWTIFVPKSATIKMTNPHFYGQDEHGRSFVLSAKEAVHKGGINSGTVSLDTPFLKLSTGPERTVQISSKSGAYDQKTRQAALLGGVSLSDTGSGFTLQTAETRIDTRSGLVTGAKPVQGHGPLGDIVASSYVLDTRAAKATFQGGVRTHFVGKRGR